MILNSCFSLPKWVYSFLSSSALNIKGSKSVMLSTIRILPVSPASIIFMGDLCLISYSEIACLQAPQGYKGWFTSNAFDLQVTAMVLIAMFGN